MPIRGLDQLKDIAHIATKRPCAVLQNTAIAVDGFWFLRKYLMPASITSVLVHGLGRFYVSILNVFKKFVYDNKIDVIWIWNGFEFSKPQMPIAYDPLEMGIEEIKRGNIVSADKHLRKVVSLEEFVDEINHFLQKDTERICCIRAPYSALAQCAYFLHNNVVDYVFGATDFFLYDGGEKVITEFNFLLKEREDRIEILYRRDIIKALKLSFSKFQMYALLLGCEYCATMPPYSTNFQLFEILEVLRIGNYSYGYLKAFLYSFYETDRRKNGSKPNAMIDNYLHSFMVARTVLDYHPVMSSNGTIELLRDTNVPRDLDDILGAKKAAYFYEQLFLCNIKPNYQKYAGHKLNYIDKDGNFRFNRVRDISMLVQFLVLELAKKNFFNEDILLKLLLLLDYDSITVDKTTINDFLHKHYRLIEYHREIVDLYTCYVNRCRRPCPFSLKISTAIHVLSANKIKEKRVVNYLSTIYELLRNNADDEGNCVAVIKFLDKILHS